MPPQSRFALPPSTMQNAWQRQSESGLARLAALPSHIFYFNEGFMIDPKQGPLFHIRRSAEPFGPSRTHLAKRASADAAPEPKHAGKRPFASKRHFSVVVS